MAGDWIKMRCELWDHPKVVRILSAMCPQSVRDTSAKCRIVGALYRTWCLADQYTQDGILEGYDAAALNQAIGIEGWAENLQHVGWLIIEPQRLIVPEFTEHCGQSAKRRAEDSKRKKVVRKLSAKRPQEVGQNADQRREEKSREDIGDKSPITPAASIPSNLDSPEFSDAWETWKQHRKEIKHPLKPTMETQQLAMLAEWGPIRAIAAIRHTVAMGWQGLKEPIPQQAGGGYMQRPKKDYTL